MSELDAASEFDDVLLSAYVDNELTPAERGAVEERLRTDERARRLVAELRQASAAVRGLPRITLGRDVAGSVLAAIDKQQPAAAGRIEAASRRSMQEAPSQRHSSRTNTTGRTWAWGALAVAAALMVMAMWPGGDRRDDRQLAQTEADPTPSGRNEAGRAAGDQAAGAGRAQNTDEMDALAEPPAPRRAIEARSGDGPEGSAVATGGVAPSSGPTHLAADDATPAGPSVLSDAPNRETASGFAAGAAGANATADAAMSTQTVEAAAESLAAAPLGKDQEGAAEGGLNAGRGGAARAVGMAPPMEQWSDALGANLVQVAPGGVATLERALVELQIGSGGQDALPGEVASQWVPVSDQRRGAADADTQAAVPEAILVEATPEAIARLVAALPRGSVHGPAERYAFAADGAAEAPRGGVEGEGSTAAAAPQQPPRAGRSWRLVRRATPPLAAAPEELAGPRAAAPSAASASPRGGGGFGGGDARGARKMRESATAATARVLFVVQGDAATASPAATGESSPAASGAAEEPAAGSRPANRPAEEK